jgi:methionyl-tRNA synthetase
MTSEPAKKATFALTTPLYYVNDLPHIGSAYPTIAADTLARLKRLQGQPVLFVTGTDEHGQKIQRTAASLGRSPQAHCDLVVEGFKSLWEKLNIRYDRFIRTTDPRHAAIVAEFFQRVWANGDIYLSQQKGWYCVACEEFKEERELLENHHCTLHPTKAAEWRDEENYFFRLSNYQAKLEALYRDQVDFIQPESRRNEVLNFVSQGLRDFSISRINLDWGFPVPNDAKHTLYVWFDALLGYITALLDPDSAPTLEHALAQWWPINIHLIGKDILRFHAVYWPAMLMSANLPLPGQVFGHGFLVRDGLKMGKTTGNTIDPVALVDRYGADAVRYFFLRGIRFGQDGVFEETRFVDMLNADLANGLGNLLNRTMKMAHKYCGGYVPDLQAADLPRDHPLKTIGGDLGDRVLQSYSALAFSEGCEAVLNLIQGSNKFIDDQAPWKLFGQGEQAAVEQLLYAVLESIRLAAYLLSPIVPTLSSSVYQQLGFSGNFDDPDLADSWPYSHHSHWGLLPARQALGDPQPVFQRLELPQAGSAA